MFIVNILILIFISLIISFLINKDFEDTIPPVIFMLLLILYGVAIIGKSHHSYAGTIILFGMVWVFYIYKNKRPFPTIQQIKTKILKPSVILYFVLICFMYFAYSKHFVLVWDDFHYNATFPKDMYYYGTMPTGSHSATFYRSYLPLMQLFFYWGFQGARSFSEPIMFWYKTFLIYTCILPIMKHVNFGSRMKRISVGVICALLPFAFMYEMIDSLSMDTFMASILGYALVEILFVRKRDIFNYAKIILSLSCLTLVKQISPIFTCVALGTWFVCDFVYFFEMKNADDALPSDEKSLYKKNFRNNLFGILVGAVSSGVFYFSWKLFCNIKGNTVYLSGKLSESVSGGLFALPDYGLATILNFIKSFFTYSMNLSMNGMSLAVLVVLTIIGMVIISKNIGYSKSVSAGFVVVILGLLGYLAVLLYTFIFVFEQWEAESLSSIDRYFGTYAIPLAMILVAGFSCGFVGSGISVLKQAKLYKYGLPVMAGLMLVSFPWLNIYRSFVPSAYLRMHADEYQTKLEVEEELKSIIDMGLEERRFLYVTNEANTFYARDSVYDLIPFVPSEMEVYAQSGDLSAELLQKCQNEDDYYVYFAGRLFDDKTALNNILGAITPGLELERGKLYYYDKERNVVDVTSDIYQ